MRDWDAVVRRELHGVDASKEANEAARELASHLEDSYLELRDQGVSEADAAQHVLESAGDWKALGRALQNSNPSQFGMNDRTRQLWLPALCSLTIGNLILLALTRAALMPQAVAAYSGASFPRIAMIADYLPWIAAQPLAGAAGAYLCSLAGGRRFRRLIAGLFPAIVMVGCWAIVIPASSFAERNTWVSRHPGDLVLGGCIWTLPCAMSLLFGTLPFLGRTEETREASHND